MEHELVDSKTPKASGKAPGHSEPKQQQISALTPVGQILQMQRTIGNRATTRFIQAKLEVSHVGDPEELEADQVAQRMTTAPLQRHASRDTDSEAPNGVLPHAEAAVSTASTSTGQPLPANLRTNFEQSLGADLSAVRIHTGAASVEANKAVSARAYATGNDIHFNAGQYNPASSEGQRLLAHEVVHTVQQSGTVHRDFNFFGPSSGTTPAAGPGTNPVAPGLGQSTPGTPGMAFGGGAALLAPNADAFGVPYDVPGSDWKAAVQPIPLPLDKPMPQASIPKPTAIPGWKAPIPPHEVQVGSLKTTAPGDPNYVVTRHSGMIASAWDYYIYHVCQDVESTWNSGTASINSFTQASGSGGNESLEMLLKDMKAASKWDLAANAQGKGSMADQANASSAKSTGGQGSVSAIAKGIGDLTYVPSPKVDKTTDFTKSLDATGKAGGPVQEEMQKVQTAHEHYTAQLQKCATQGQSLAGAAQTLQGAGLAMKAKELDEKKEDLEKQKKDIESGKAGLAKINPQLAEIFVDCKDIYEKLEKVVEASKIEKVGEKLEAENYLGAAKEAASGVMAVVKLEKIEALDKQIAAVVADKKSALDASTVATFEGAKTAFAAALAAMKTLAAEADTFARDERNAMTALATAVEKNWKGQTGDPVKDQQQAKLAAGAIRGLPIANKILSLVQEVRKNVPTKLPEASGFNSDKAHTLATQGVGAPGDAELVTVAGWILGIQPAIDNEIDKWQGIVGQLQLVVSKLGLQL